LNLWWQGLELILETTLSSSVAYWDLTKEIAIQTTILQEFLTTTTTTTMLTSLFLVLIECDCSTITLSVNPLCQCWNTVVAWNCTNLVVQKLGT